MPHQRELVITLQATSLNETVTELELILYEAKLALVFPDYSYSGTDISRVTTLTHLLSADNAYSYSK